MHIYIYIILYYIILICVVNFYGWIKSCELLIMVTSLSYSHGLNIAFLSIMLNFIVLVCIIRIVKVEYVTGFTKRGIIHTSNFTDFDEA